MIFDEQSKQKQQAAEQAVEFVQSGMVVGLGTGSTAIFATHRIAYLLSTGQLKNITGIATSRATEAEARWLGIPLVADDLPIQVDITIDGADELDSRLWLIKGGGGALLREKIVAQASHRVIIVADESKLSDQLGTKFKLPVEVLRFGWRSQARYLESLGANIKVRQTAAGSQFATDSGNLVLDCRFGPIADPAELAVKLNRRAGIVEHGLFIEIATDAIIAGKDGIRHLTKQM
jgi:ribose 5-phosphate isomerase A